MVAAALVRLELSDGQPSSATVVSVIRGLVIETVRGRQAALEAFAASIIPLTTSRLPHWNASEAIMPETMASFLMR